MNIKEYSYVAKIAELGSFSEAAAAAHISQPSLSMYIQHLEARLGMPLFNRGKGGASPTYACERFLSYASQILSLDSLLEKELDDLRATRAGKVAIGVTLTRGAYIVPLVLPAFKRAYPAVETRLVEGTSSVLEGMLTQGQIDLAFLALPLGNQALRYDRLFDEELVLAVPRDHPACGTARPSPGFGYPWLDIAALRGEDFILINKGQRLRHFSDEIFKEAGFEPRVSIETSNAISAHKLAAAGLGLTFFSDALIKEEASPDLAYFSIGTGPRKWNMAIFSNPACHLSKAAGAFIEVTKRLWAQV